MPCHQGNINWLTVVAYSVQYFTARAAVIGAPSLVVTVRSVTPGVVSGATEWTGEEGSRLSSRSRDSFAWSSTEGRYGQHSKSPPAIALPSFVSSHRWPVGFRPPTTTPGDTSIHTLPGRSEGGWSKVQPPTRAWRNLQYRATSPGPPASRSASSCRCLLNADGPGEPVDPGRHNQHNDRMPRPDDSWNPGMVRKKDVRKRLPHDGLNERTYVTPVPPALWAPVTRRPPYAAREYPNSSPASPSDAMRVRISGQVPPLLR